MCMITLYRDSIKEENKIADDISRYTLELAADELTVYPIFKDPLEFNINEGISWDESSDSMVIE